MIENKMDSFLALLCSALALMSIAPGDVAGQSVDVASGSGIQDGPALSGVDIELVSAKKTALAWTATEWRVNVDASVDGDFRMDPECVGPHGVWGVSLKMDVEGPLDEGALKETGSKLKMGDVWRRIAANPYLIKEPPAQGVGANSPNESSRGLFGFDVILHGRIAVKQDQVEGDGGRRLQFTPVFGAPGMYRVRAVIRRGAETAYSNVIAIRVLPAPNEQAGVIKDLEQFVSSGICLDVRALHALKGGLSAEQIGTLEQFSRRNIGNPYGQQMAIALSGVLVKEGELNAKAGWSSQESLLVARDKLRDAGLWLRFVIDGQHGLEKLVAKGEVELERLLAKVEERREFLRKLSPGDQ